MKKLIWVVVAVLFVGCGPSDDDSSKDQLLSGTAWKYEIETNPLSNISTDSISVATIIGYFPNLQYTKGESFTVEEVDTVLTSWINQVALLEFGNTDCSYSEEVSADATFNKIQHKFQPYTFVEQTSLSSGGNDTLKITKDGMYYYRLNSQYGSKLRSLSSFKIDDSVERKTISSKTGSVSEKKEENFTFSRTNKQINITNGSIKMLGILSDDNKSMKLVQIYPASNDTLILERK